MADEGAAPGSLTRRWDDVPEGRRVLLYLARRKLGLSPAEWDALSWDTQRCYVEGMADEGLINLPEPAAEAGNDLISGDISALSGYSVQVVSGAG